MAFEMKNLANKRDDETLMREIRERAKALRGRIHRGASGFEGLFCLHGYAAVAGAVDT